jgi:hypothetical protein
LCGLLTEAGAAEEAPAAAATPTGGASGAEALFKEIQAKSEGITAGAPAPMHVVCVFVWLLMLGVQDCGTSPRT